MPVVYPGQVLVNLARGRRLTRSKWSKLIFVGKLVRLRLEACRMMIDENQVIGRGNPLADVARTWLLHRLATSPYGFPGRLVIDPVLATRLAENVEGEKERFQKIIEKLLRRL